MEQTKKGFFLYRNIVEAGRMIEDTAARLELFEGIFSFMLDDTEPSFSRPESEMIWKAIRPGLDTMRKRANGGYLGGPSGHLGGNPNFRKGQPNPYRSKTVFPATNEEIYR